MYSRLQSSIMLLDAVFAVCRHICAITATLCSCCDVAAPMHRAQPAGKWGLVLPVLTAPALSSFHLSPAHRSTGGHDMGGIRAAYWHYTAGHIWCRSLPAARASFALLRSSATVFGAGCGSLLTGPCLFPTVFCKTLFHILTVRSSCKLIYHVQRASM